MPIYIYLKYCPSDSRRECPLAGIPTGGNAHGRECPPLISLEVGIRGSGYSRFCRSGIPTRCHWPHPSRRYPAPLSRLMKQRVEVGAHVVHVMQYQAKSAQAESRLPQIIIPLIHKM